MKQFFIGCLFLLAFNPILAQNQPFYTMYDWVNNPKFSVESDTEEEILEIKNKVITEFAYDSKGALVEYSLEHRVIWLNSDPAIESFNKIYLPYSSSSVLEVSKARVIIPTGKVLELDESDIKTAQDEETGRQYKYFAFSGVEKGSFIEYFYVERKDPDYNGARVFLQSQIEKKEVSFDLYSPENLVFEFQSLNDLPEMVLDTLTEGKLHWKVKLDSMKKLEEEELSAYNASRASVVYKLDHNLANNTRDISSYGAIAQNLYSFYYPEISKKTQKGLEKFLTEAIGNIRNNEEATVRNLEYFIKNNVYYTQGNSPGLSDLDEILEKKVASSTGLLKLYAATLTALNVKHEMVLTTDRQELKFDPQFEAGNFLSDVLLYFPDFKTYLAPTDTDSRYGFPPSYFTDNYGLFIKKVSLGGLTSGLGRVDYIDPVTADKTFDKMLINVDFDAEDLSTLKVKLDRGINGYYAMNIHPFMNLIKEDDKIELIENFARNLDEGAEIISREVLNSDPALFGIKPLRFVLDFKSDAFIEKAGNRYIFKVGELIGRQVELYQEKERVLPLEEQFHRSYYRTITINLPSGYQIANPDDLNINNSFSRNGKELLSFHSYYELKDNVLTITADEHYRVNQLSAEEFQEYRKVINSAADFNKISLILEPTTKS